MLSDWCDIVMISELLVVITFSFSMLVAVITTLGLSVLIAVIAMTIVLPITMYLINREKKND